MENPVRSSSGRPRPISVEPKAVDIGAIEAELKRLWDDAPADEEPAVTRACMSNLLIFSSTQERARRIAPEMASIVERHPARVVLMVADETGAPGDIEAYVSAQCHVIGGGRQVCSEHVTVNAGAGALHRLPSVARPLLIGDLPTALWWETADAPPLAGELFDELATMSDLVIYDSFDWLDAVRGVIATAQWAASETTDQTVADLAWRRLNPWRRLIGESLDPAVMPGAVEQITEIVIEHGPHGLPQAWLLTGWLATCLHWQPAVGAVAPGVEVSWQFRSRRGAIRVTIRRLEKGAPEVRRISITWEMNGRAETATFSETAPRRLGVAMSGREFARHALTIPMESRATLVAEQLPELERDPLFQRSLAMARSMAEALRPS
jgi:glucose-6-phosphate dehydrogenase assembly protein OpcA